MENRNLEDLLALMTFWGLETRRLFLLIERKARPGKAFLLAVFHDLIYTPKGFDVIYPIRLAK